MSKSSKLKLSKKPKVAVEFDGQDFELERPNAFLMAEIEDKVKGLMDDGSAKELLNHMYNFLVDLGLPEDVAKELDFDHYTEIFEALKGSKKN